MVTERVERKPSRTAARWTPGPLSQSGEIHKPVHTNHSLPTTTPPPPSHPSSLTPPSSPPATSDLDGFLQKKRKKHPGVLEKQSVFGNVRETFFYTSDQVMLNAMAGKLDLDAREDLCIEQVAACVGDLA